MAKNSIRQWSGTAASNTDIAGISLAEGVTKPSDVNDFERAHMGQIAQYLAEMSFPTVGGTSDALTLTPTTGLAALASNVVYTGTILSANATQTPTLNVSGLGAKVIRKISGNTDVALSVGDLPTGGLATFVYSTTANSSGGAWLIPNPVVQVFPVGPLTNLASASTTDLGTIGSHNINITGTTTITAFGSTAATGQPFYYLQFPSGLTITANATSLITPGGLNLVLGAGSFVTASYLGSGNWRILDAYDPTAIPTTVPAINGYLFGGQLTNNASAPTTSIDISAGNCVDSTGVRSFVLPALTKNISLSWVVGNNQGSLSTGSIANGTYHVFAIMRPDTGVVDYITDVSPTSPTLPTNYVYFRRLASIVRASAAVQTFIQDGDRFYWSNTSGLTPEYNSGSSRAKGAMAVNVPSGIRVEGIFQGQFGGNAPGTGTLTWFDGVNTSISKFLQGGNAGSGGNGEVAGVFTQFTNTSAQIQFQYAPGSGGGNAVTTTLGWIDSRGRT